MPQSSAAKVPSHELEELRRTELEAIESILGLDFRILTPKAWHGASTSHVETYEVTLRPEIDRQKAHVAVVVEMSLTKNYPNVAPTCRVKVNDSRTRGVSRSQLSRLEDCMNAQARSLCGAEMIWELVSFGQEFISSNNQAPKEHTGTKLSLEERMRQRADAEKEVRMYGHLRRMHNVVRLWRSRKSPTKNRSAQPCWHRRSRQKHKSSTKRSSIK